MAFYHALRTYEDDPLYPGKAAWIADHLLELRKELFVSIQADRTPGTLIIGSWNIRAFDEGKPRMDESYHYIAEIIDKFDICAVQEVKSDLGPLRRLVKLLGPSWEYFVTDVTDGGPGNRERMAFLYNTNRVFFRSLIGELSLPREDLVRGNQIARSPFFASFQAGWFKFTLCSAHIIFGGSSSDDKSLRAEEIGMISKILAKRAKKEDEVYVFLGDMNIESTEDKMMKAMTDHGLYAPKFGPTNMSGSKHFDQIAFTHEDVKTNLLRAGSFDWRDAVFGDDDRDHYQVHAERARGKPYADWKKSYRNWTTHEMSDHLPIWIEIRTDYSDDYLKRYT